MNTFNRNLAMVGVTACVIGGSFIEVKAEQPTLIGVAISNTYIRKGASSKHEVIIKVPKGSEVEIMGKVNKNGWVEAKYKNKSGWLYMPKVEEKKISSPVRYVNGVHRIPLRESATSKSELLGYIYEGDKVEVVDYKGVYARIKYNGRIYYALKENLSTKNPAKVMYITGVWRKVLKSGYLSTSKTLGYVMEGEAVTVLGYRKGHAHIKYNDKRYYIKNSCLNEKNPVEYKYIDGAEKVAVTYGGDKVVGYVGRGQKVKVFGEKDGYTRISFNGQTGFIKGKSKISKYSTKTVVCNGAVNVYSDMKNNNEIGSVPDGMNLTIVAENSNWGKIKYGGSYAYIEKKYLKQIKYIEKSGGVVLRKSASSDSEKICNIENGKKVEIVSYSSGYAKVKYNGKTGYIENQYMVIDKKGSNESFINGLPSDSLNYNLRYTNVDNVRVYKNPLVDDTAQGYLTKGSAVKFISHLDGNYTKVSVNDSIIGYIKRSHLSQRNPLAKNTSSVVTKNISKTHTEYVKTQENNPYVKIEDVKYYSNPLNFSITNDDEKYQFLKINTFKNINAYDLNVYLSNLPVDSGKEAIFKNQGSAFISAAKKYNIDPIYLVAHTMLETGYGSSKLAQGIVVTKDAAGNNVAPTKVYNLFGIGAIDADADGGGSKTAYALGWTSIPKAIEGAAKWIAQGVDANPSVGLKKSDGYIHSSRFTHQYTLYAMRWDYINGWHQYATDVEWCKKISKLMNKLSYLYEGANLVFEIPSYAKEKIILQAEELEPEVVEDEENINELDEEVLEQVVVDVEDNSKDECYEEVEEESDSVENTPVDKVDVESEQDVITEVEEQSSEQ